MIRPTWSSCRRHGKCVLLLVAAAACSSTGPSGSAAGKLYVADALNNKIWIFATGATRDTDAVPTATIEGSHTGLNVPEGLALDPAGRLYVSNFNGNSITVYAAGASGDAAPIATLAGGSTGLAGPIGLAFDGTGQLYVVNGPGPGIGTVTVYPAGATGNVVPTATIGGPTTRLDNPWGVAVDASGQIYVSSAGDSILVYAPGATGDAAPVAAIAGPSTGLNTPLGLVLTPGGRQHGGQRLYVANFRGNSITVYSGSAVGDAAPIATIAGPATGLAEPGAVALDGTGHVYAGNNVTRSVTSYNADATGNVRSTPTMFLQTAGVRDIEAIAIGP